MAKGLRIVAKKDGFRRAGIAHTSEPQEYPLSKFSKEQVEQLKKDPMLVVQEIEISEPKGKDKDPK